MITQEAITKHVEECISNLPRMGEGPWQTEPHYEQFKAFGLDCVIARNPALFFWCGYVGVPKGHPLYGKEYDDIDGIVEVHGGLTYSSACSGHICHTPAPGDPDELYWLGFDCGHAFDTSPGMTALNKEMQDLMPERAELFKRMDRYSFGEYRDYTYVVGVTKSLAEQLSDM
jgi:hypothetical protein